MNSIFEKEVAHAFKPLCKRFGFRQTLSGPLMCRFESEKVFVNIFFDVGRSYELGIAIGPINFIEPGFSLAEILNYKHAPEAANWSFIQAGKESSIPPLVRGLSELLIKYAYSFLTEGEVAFANLVTFRKKECHDYQQKINLKRVRAQAEVAWSEKRYHDFVALMKEHSSALSTVEIEKLHYAEKKSSAQHKE